MKVKHECLKCKNKFELINGQTLKEVKLENLFITYVECPECGEVSVVQIDNEETKEIISEIINKFRVISTMGKSTKKQSARLNKLNKKLNNLRKKLHDAYGQTCCSNIKYLAKSNSFNSDGGKQNGGSECQ